MFLTVISTKYKFLKFIEIFTVWTYEHFVCFGVYFNLNLSLMYFDENSDFFALNNAYNNFNEFEKRCERKGGVTKPFQFCVWILIKRLW